MVFEYGVRVTDVDFTTDEDGVRRARRLHLERDGHPDAYELTPADYAFLTLGSMTADASYGTDYTAPELVRDKRDGGWRLWETLASFTLTMRTRSSCTTSRSCPATSPAPGR